MNLFQMKVYWLVYIFGVHVVDIGQGKVICYPLIKRYKIDEFIFKPSPVYDCLPASQASLISLQL
jgi:hypothetical protein